MRKSFVVLVLVLVACGPTNGATGDDQGGATDALGGSAGGSGSGNGSGHVPVVDTITCQTHTVTTTNADGTRTVSDTRFALVNGIDPTSDFTIEQCDYTETVNGAVIQLSGLKDQACPAGATCVASGAPYPTYAHGCYFQKGGSFVDAQLVISCGSAATTYSAANVVTYAYDLSYNTIRLHH